MNEARPEILSALHELRFTRFLNSRMLPAPPKGYCKWCGGKAARVWCCTDCRREGYIRMGYYLRYVFERDKGICAICGIDAVWLGRKIVEIYRLWRKYHSVSFSEYTAHFGPWGTEAYKQFWEAHHIIPVSLGGGCCGLENYRTICLRCHKKETADLAKRRSKDFRPTSDTLFPMSEQNDLDNSQSK